MSLPVYFVGGNAQCGWHCAPDGTLAAPNVGEGQVEALVFDDSAALPEDARQLAADLVHAAAVRQAKVVILDFERPPTQAACSFVRQLCVQCRTAAPSAFCAGTAAEPIACYDAAKVLFSDFLRQLTETPHSWLELRPIDTTLCYPAQGIAPAPESAAFFSAELQCHCRLQSRPDGYCLRLFDTPESFRNRFALLAPHLCAAIGLRTELEAISFSVPQENL